MYINPALIYQQDYPEFFDDNNEKSPFRKGNVVVINEKTLALVLGKISVKEKTLLTDMDGVVSFNVLRKADVMDLFDKNIKKTTMLFNYLLNEAVEDMTSLLYDTLFQNQQFKQFDPENAFDNYCNSEKGVIEFKYNGFRYKITIDIEKDED